MEEKNNGEKLDEVMLPGFRFHPTDEELVGFYLKRKVQHRPLSIELIKQLDIYKYDPWDLPKMATTGEKEWYFYVPRDRKYRNSARPNRVTGAGFWKATGTDRPIYSSEGSKCIGLKKSLVFYKGRAAKGIKTDWMMHEFRLPSLVDSTKKIMDKTIPINDSWAICRIFKKTNSIAQRALSHSFVSHSTPKSYPNSTQLPITSKNTTSYDLQYNNHIQNANNILQYPPTTTTNTNTTTNFPGIDFYNVSTFKPVLFNTMEKSYGDLSSSFISSPPPSKSSSTINDVFLNMPSSFYGDYSNLSKALWDYNDNDNDNVDDFEGMLLQEQLSCPGLISMSSNPMNNLDDGQVALDDYQYWETTRSVGGYPLMGDHGLKHNNFVLDSSLYASDMASLYSTTKCYT